MSSVSGSGHGSLQREQLSASSLAVYLGAVALLHAAFWKLPTPDYTQFLQYWYRHLADQGLAQAFAAPFGNYSPPYLYLLGLLTFTEPFLAPLDAIKTLSLAGNAWLAFAVFRLLSTAKAGQEERGGLLVLLLPTMAAQVVFFSQCDALWAAPCVLAVTAAIERRHAAMLVWAGVAFAFKAQAAFLAPFLFAVLLSRRVGPGYWLIPPLVTAAMMVPAWLAGWPARDLLLVYIRQGGQLQSFISNAPDPWVLGAVLAPELTRPLIPFGFLLSAIAALALAWRLRLSLGSAREIVTAALLSAILVPFVLPKMHERYFLLTDVLAFALAYAWPGRATIGIALATSLGSALAIVAYLWQRPEVAILGAASMSVALVLVIRELRAVRR